MTNWSRGYEMLRSYVRFAFWLTHKKVVVTGSDKIPQNKPLIFAPNHQNALMDPLALVCTNRHQSVWLARADIFRSKTAGKILKFFKMLPVYRIRDGKDNLSNNEQIFAQVSHILESGQSAAMFPEAAHSGRRQMLPHKKAIPRIALETEEKNNFELGLQIVPVGIYYDHYWLFNRSLIVQYGAPVDVDRYKPEYAENQQKAMLRLRDEIHDRIIPLTIQINSKDFYNDYENLRQVAGDFFSKTKTFSKNKTLNRFYADQELIFRMEKLESMNTVGFEEIVSAQTSYFQELKKLNLTNELVAYAAKISPLWLIVQLIASLLTLPVFVLGFIFNALPYFTPRSVVRRKVKDSAFISTFNFVIGLVVFPVFYFVSAMLIFAVSGSVVLALIAFILMPFVGKIAFGLLQFYSELYKCVALFCCRRSLLKQTIRQRNELIELIFKPGNGISNTVEFSST